jgi:hypothetical protein
MVDDVQDCFYAVLPNIDPNRPVLATALAAGGAGHHRRAYPDRP